MMMVGRRSKKFTKICLISKGPHGVLTLRGGHCHTCDSLTPHIHIGPDAGLTMSYGVGGILVCCKTCLQVPDSRVRAWSQQSCLRRDKIQYFGKVLQNSPLTSHKMELNRAILTMILPC